MKNKIKLKGRLFCRLLLLLLAVSCRKDAMPEKTTAPPSASAPDLAQRLVAIKKQYHDEKLGVKFIAKDEKGITWTPEWDKPRLETVNDSISYVFYRMIGTLKREGKLAKVQEIGAATYLMVKNGKEFYKAFYYVPEEKRSKDPSEDASDAIMKHFTGTLLLSSLRGGRSYLLDYVNGKVSEAYKKNQSASRKLQAVGGATAYWEQQCETVIRHCTFVSAGYSLCGGEIMVIYSYSCHWPQPMCGVTFYMTDSGEETVCQQVWFPDPPSGGGSGGSDGDSDGIPEVDIKNATYFDEGKPKIKDIKKYTDCFNDGKTAKSYTMTIYADQPIKGKGNWFRIVKPGVSTNQYGIPTGIIWTTPSGDYFDSGHTFVTFEKNNIDGTNVRQTLGFYPDGFTAASKGVIVDNGGHEADVSYTINVSQQQFEKGVNKMKEDFANAFYRLDNLSGTEYNCTDAAISWMNAAGAQFKDSSFGMFKNTPGSFGQVLKEMPGANLYPQNGIYGKGPCN